MTARLARAGALAAALSASGCGGGSSPGPGTPSGGEPAVPPGATRITGSERLAWQQAGTDAPLRFLAFVDDSAVWLDSAQCDGSRPEAACSSPLPPMADGSHTLAVAAVAEDSGAEGPRSESITVYKVTSRSVVSASSLPDARVHGAAIAQTFVTAGGQSVTADVVARGLEASAAQLSALPDGRLLVADGGRVLLWRPERSDAVTVALEAHALPSPQPIGSAGVAADPAFARTRFVFLAFLARETSGAVRLRIVRLREAGDVLGEAATIYEAPLASRDGHHFPSAGPRAAFGPDGLLHVLLPAGAVFDDPRLASQPFGTMLRIDTDGRVAERQGFGGDAGAPLGFGWHAAAGMMGLIEEASGQVALQAIDLSATGPPASTLLTASRDARSGVVTPPPPSSGVLGLLQRLAGAHDPAAIGTFRLAAPIRIDAWLSGLSATVHDVVAGAEGTYFLVLRDGSGARGTDDGSAIVARIRPVD